MAVLTPLFLLMVVIGMVAFIFCQKNRVIFKSGAFRTFKSRSKVGIPFSSAIFLTFLPHAVFESLFISLCLLHCLISSSASSVTEMLLHEREYCCFAPLDQMQQLLIKHPLNSSSPELENCLHHCLWYIKTSSSRSNGRSKHCYNLLKIKLQHANHKGLPRWAVYLSGAACYRRALGGGSGPGAHQHGPCLVQLASTLHGASMLVVCTSLLDRSIAFIYLFYPFISYPFIFSVKDLE